MRDHVAQKKNGKEQPLRTDLVLKLADLERNLSIELDHQAHEVEHAKELMDHFVAGKPEPTAPVEGTGSPEKSVMLSTLIDKYLEELGRSDLRRESLLGYQGDFGQFKSIFGDGAVGSVNHEVLNQAKDVLVQLPPNINKAKELQGKTIDEILACGLPPQAAFTVRKKWARYL